MLPKSSDETPLANEAVHDDDTDTGSSTIEAPMALGDAPPPIDDPELTDDNDDLLAGLDLDLSVIDDAPPGSGSTRPQNILKKNRKMSRWRPMTRNQALSDIGNLGDLADDDLFAMPDSIDQSSAIQDEPQATTTQTRTPTPRHLSTFPATCLSPMSIPRQPHKRIQEPLQNLRMYPSGEDSGSSKPRRKPARLKLAYSDDDDLVVEYQENLRRGGCFVSTTKPSPWVGP